MQAGGAGRLRQATGLFQIGDCLLPFVLLGSFFFVFFLTGGRGVFLQHTAWG